MDDVPVAQLRAVEIPNAPGSTWGIGMQHHKSLGSKGYVCKGLSWD